MDEQAQEQEEAAAAPAVTEGLTGPQTPSVGRIVHYVLPHGSNPGDHRPAIIVRVWGEGPAVQLQVFTDGSNDGIDYASGVVWKTSVDYSAEGLYGTWHWPERV